MRCSRRGGLLRVWIWRRRRGRGLNMGGLRFSIPVTRRRLGSTGEINPRAALTVCLHPSLRIGKGSRTRRRSLLRRRSPNQHHQQHVSGASPRSRGAKETRKGTTRKCTVAAARTRFITLQKWTARKSEVKIIANHRYTSSISNYKSFQDF